MNFVSFPKINQLRTSIALALLKQQTKEPQYEALGSWSSETARISETSEYAGDILRVLQELELSISLASNLPSDDFFLAHKTTKEDFVMYHLGHYLDLVHQLKDKVVHFVDGSFADSSYKEKKYAKVHRLLNQDKVQKVPRLVELLKMWQETYSDNEITKTLRKRSNYHHFRNRLLLNRDFLDIKFSRTMQEEPVQQILSEKGKVLAKEKGEKGFQKWHAEFLKNMTETLEIIKQNIEEMADLVTTNLSLPLAEKDGLVISEQYFKMEESLKIKNVAGTSFEKTAFNPIIQTIKTGLTTFFKNTISSIYLVGSTTRGDAIRGVSDVNVIVVVDDKNKILVPVINRMLVEIPRITGEKVSGLALSLGQLKGEDQKRLRFICKTDGLVIHGVDQLEEETFPKPGLGLVCLFNQGIKDRIARVRDLIENNPNLPQEEVSDLARSVAKVVLRLMFGAVMADTARYERNFSKMYEAVLEKYPQNKSVTDLIYKLVIGEGTVDFQNLKNLLTGFDDGSCFGELLKDLEKKCEGLKEKGEYK